MILPLIYPPGFLNISPTVKAEVCNGAGAKDGIKVPNTMWGLNMKEVFDIHDFDYWMGENEEDKREADRRMLNNAIIMICNQRGWMMYARGLRAISYFMAVAILGNKAFYAGKETNG